MAYLKLKDLSEAIQNFRKPAPLLPRMTKHRAQKKLRELQGILQLAQEIADIHSMTAKHKEAIEEHLRTLEGLTNQLRKEFLP